MNNVWQIGDIKITRVIELEVAGGSKFILPDATREEVQKIGWLAPHFASGALEPLLADWSKPFSGPFLYYPGRRHLPAPLRAFVDFVQAMRDEQEVP